MKQIVSVSLGSKKLDYEFETEFLGQDFNIKRFGVDGDLAKAEKLLMKWNNKADVIGLGDIQFPKTIGMNPLTHNDTIKLKEFSAKMTTPVTTGEAMHNVGEEWVLRYVQHTLGNYFTNAKVFFHSGMIDYSMAKIMAGFTDNIVFADPIHENGIPKFITTIKDLEMYAKGLHNILDFVPTKMFSSSIRMVKEWNSYVLRKAMQKASVIVVPYNKFDDYMKDTTVEELGGKIIITPTVYPDRIAFLKERGVDVIIDPTPKILERVVGINVLEALIMAALEKDIDSITNDDFLEIISEQKMDPRIIYPSGEVKRKNRFAFVIHPLSQDDFKKEKSIQFLTQVPAFVDAIEKVMAYSPPFIYSKMTGIKSPLGVEAEGWLITVGGTPKQMLSHSPEFTYKRLLQAAKMAKRLGAQIMGLGAFTKVVGDAGITVSRKAEIPITTGNSYSASGALWAAADAARRMGLIKAEKGKKLKAKTMVVGATGAIGSVCCRLLAMAFDELYMIDIRDARLLGLKESILKENPDTKIYIGTRADKYVSDMDIIVTATSSAGKKVLDIMDVKPGCIITDVARPLDLSKEDVAKRPDVLVIESGEILLPGNPKFKDIGLPPKVAYACLAETIVLALEGRFEIFTIGREIEWQKVKDIYQLGIKHGMKLAAISGVNGVYTDADIKRVKKLALKARAEKATTEKEAPELKLLFERALKNIHKAKEKPGNADMLELYSLYKQGTTGNCSGDRPGITELVARAKFDAWNKIKGLSKDQAMKKYVDKVDSLI